MSEERINEIFITIGESVIKESDQVLSENHKDLDRMNVTDPKIEWNITSYYRKYTTSHV